MLRPQEAPCALVIAHNHVNPFVLESHSERLQPDPNNNGTEVISEHRSDDYDDDDDGDDADDDDDDDDLQT